MKRHTALYTLSHDHHQGLILAQQLKKNAPHYKGMTSTLDGKKEYAISFYNTKLVKHFEDEERILFPAVIKRDKEVDELVEEIVSEHRKIELLVNDLMREIDVEDLLDKLGKLLENHIRKEERNLFPTIEKILTEEDLVSINKRLNSSGRSEKK